MIELNGAEGSITLTSLGSRLYFLGFVFCNALI